MYACAMSWTIATLVEHAIERFLEEKIFCGHGPLDESEEAEFLVLRSLGIDFETPFDYEQPVPEDKAREVLARIERRAADKVPTSYILKEAWLAGQRFYCDERVLVPRSFIAELLDEGLEPWVLDPEAVTSVLDLCTGSACLAILAHLAFPNARVTASDISQDALEVAEINVAQHDAQGSVTLKRSDLFAALPGEKFDVIVSNPPYVTREAMDALPEEYRKEPALGLAAGDDGLDVVRRILAEAARHLNEGGLLFVEVGDARQALEAAYPKTPFMWLSTQTEESMVFMLAKKDLPAC